MKEDVMTFFAGNRDYSTKPNTACLHDGFVGLCLFVVVYVKCLEFALQS